MNPSFQTNHVPTDLEIRQCTCSTLLLIFSHCSNKRSPKDNRHVIGTRVAWVAHLFFDLERSSEIKLPKIQSQPIQLNLWTAAWEMSWSFHNEQSQTRRKTKWKTQLCCRKENYAHAILNKACSRPKKKTGSKQHLQFKNSLSRRPMRRRQSAFQE
jgi:hypothetical protein